MISEVNTISQLYNNYDHGIIKEVISIEKLEHKLVRHRSARTFNVRCLQEKVIPRGCRIKFKSKTILKEKLTKKLSSN